MKQTLFIFLLLFSIKTVAQIQYEKGYIITNDNERIECLIKNKDLLSNPKSIEYKRNAGDSIRNGNLNDIKEFGISGTATFVMAEVDIDQSSTNLNDLTSTKEPIWSKEKIFLKLLVKGKANLYFYRNGNKELFFYSVNGSVIQQLIHKEYLLTAEGDFQHHIVMTNDAFKQQLCRDVINEETSFSEATALGYNRNDLIRYFRKFDKLGKDSYSGTNENKGAFNLKIKPGIDLSSISITEGGASRYAIDFGTHPNFQFGMEAEYIVPFNKNTWSLFFEPTYQHFKSSKANFRSDLVSINLNLIDFSLGVRHYFFLNENLKIQLNALCSPISILCFDPIINYVDQVYSFNYYSLKMDPSIKFSVGGGVDYKRFSLDFRYSPNRSLLNGFQFVNADYQGISFIAGYKIFDTKTAKKK